MRKTIVRIKKRIGNSAIAGTTLLGLFIGGCNGSSPSEPSPPTVTTLTVTGASGPLRSSGETVQLTATVTLSDGTVQDQTNAAGWASSDTTVATVSATGLVTAVGGGSTEIRATHLGVSGTLALEVEIVFARGPLTIPQTFTADLDLGIVGGTGTATDIWFEAETAVLRFLTPRNGATLASVGTSAPGLSGCAAAPLTDERIDFASLPTGTYVCVLTTESRLSQVLIAATPGPSPGTLEIEFTTFE